MPRRGENIYKRKDGRWEGRYIKGYNGGKAQYGYVFARTYSEVKNELATVGNTNRAMLLENKAAQKPMQSDFFSTIADAWLVSKKAQWKQSSVVKYTNILESYIFSEFANKEISGITRDEVVMFSNKLLVSGGVSGKGLSPKTVTSILSVMKNVFAYAVQAKGYRVSDLKSITVKQSQKPMRILSRIEQQKLSKYLYENINPCNLGILLCLYTGLRIGEICALKWDDVFLDEQYLYVHQTMQRLQTKNKEETTKTAIIISDPKSECSIRKVPIPEDIFNLLKECKRPGNTFLLTSATHSYMEPRTMQNHFKIVIKQCNIGDANFHALRHTFATRCVELGFDMKSLSEILGHASVNITLNRYVHPSMELKQKNMNMLSELFSVK